MSKKIEFAVRKLLEYQERGLTLEEAAREFYWRFRKYGYGVGSTNAALEIAQHLIGEF